MRTDVPIGSYLSGGVDSTLLAIAGSELLGKKFNTFTVRINEDTFNEADIAKKTSQLLGTNHHELTLNLNRYFNKNRSNTSGFRRTFGRLRFGSSRPPAEIAARM